MVAPLTGKAKAQAVADKLREEKEEVEAQNEQAKAEIINTLSVPGMQEIQVSDDTMAFFKKNATVGMEGVNDKPRLGIVLKVTESNSNNMDPDGQLVSEGNFYYTADGESVGPEIAVSIAVISRSFYTKMTPSEKELAEGKKPSARFNQLVCGYFLSNDKPFIMFATGTRLSKMWEFAQEIRPFTKHKESPVPMFAFKVQLALKKEASTMGRNHVVLYNLMKNADNQVQIITDIAKLHKYQQGIEKFQEMIDGFISHNEVDKQTLELLSDRPEPVKVVDYPAIEANDPDQQEIDIINPEPIPF